MRFGLVVLLFTLLASCATKKTESEQTVYACPVVPEEKEVKEPVFYERGFR